MVYIKSFKSVTLLSAFILLQADCLIFLEKPPLHQQPSSGASRLHASPRNTHQQSREKRNQLHRVIQSIEYYGQENDDTDRGASTQLLEAMKALSRARTQKDVILVGKALDKLDIVGEESIPIQERVLKATALSGLFPATLKILYSILDESAHMPSRIAYTAVCSALRRAGRSQQLEELMYDLASAAREQDISVDVVAWNIYLASICSFVKHPSDPILARVYKWMDPTVAKEQFCVEPDQVSFNTLLYASARVGNRTLVEKIWEEMQQRNDFEPNIRTFNSRLMVSSREERLEILEEIINNLAVTPDRYTIDLVLYALIRAGRVGDIEELIDNFVASSSEKVKKDAFSAFLTTLAQKGDVASARALFDTYIEKESAYSSVAPDTRHFNILIDGYRRLADSTLEPARDDIEGRNNSLGTRHEKRLDEEIDAERMSALAEGRKLFRRMIHLGIPKDAYTLSSMMGLCTSSDELTRLVEHSEEYLLTPAVIRSAITQSGRLGSPSVACQLFDRYAFPSMNIRVWNVLLGALAEGARQGNLALEMESISSSNHASSKTGVSSHLNGLNCTDATRVLLNIMSSTTKAFKAPFPNSQAYCLAASAFQYGATDADMALGLFRNATNAGVPADGRFVNAVFRCFGDDINAALDSWKGEIRKACLEHESRTRRAPISIYRSRNKNLVAAYDGLLYVCGRALRPDIAVRLAYAMNREGIEPNEKSLNNYRAGKRIRKQLLSLSGSDKGEDSEGGKIMWSNFLPKKPDMVDQYEDLLYVECTNYDPSSKRMSNDKRVRIIV